MKRLLLLVFVVSILLLCQIPGFSQDVGNLSNLSDAFVKTLGQAARDGITQARLSNGSYVQPETPAEKAVPLLPMSDMRRVVEDGAETGRREVCHEDWQSVYSRFMNTEQAKKKWSDKQLAYIELLHRVSHGYVKSSLRAQGGCPEKQ
jgi:hypothetical protein